MRSFIRLHINLICVLLVLFGPISTARAATDPIDSTAKDITFPGLNEIVPQAAVVTAQVAESEAQVERAENLDNVYDTLETQVESLKKLEQGDKNWEEIDTWQLNRLISTQVDYADLGKQQLAPLNTIYTHLKTLEDLRREWEQKKTYWQDWQSHFKKDNVKVPSEEFLRTRNSINQLLTRITKTGVKLVNAQQKYSPAQEIIASRLKLIDSTLNNLRRDIFRQNTRSLFEADYYRQFDRKLFSDFANNLSSSTRMPNNFFKRYGWINGLNIIGIITIVILILYRKRQPKPLNPDWLFLYRRPLSGAVFITFFSLSLVGRFYYYAPPIWKFLLTVAITVAVIRLLSATYQNNFSRRFIRSISTLFIVTVALEVFGFPVPIQELFQALLCAAAIPTCYLVVLKNRQNMLRKQLFATYTIGVVALVGLIASMLGFATLTNHLIDATLSTFILVILVQMALRMIKGGIQAFTTLDWINNRKFIKALGVETVTLKIEALLRIIVLVNSALILLIIWKLFDNLEEILNYFLNLEYTLGEFSLSLRMVLMIVVVLYLTTLFSWVIQAFLDSQVMTPKNMDIGVKESLKRLTHYGLFFVGFLVAVSMAGLDLQKFTILAGALGVGIGFGLQNIVNNFVSGLILLFERPVKIGDTINIDQNWGTITRIGLRSTVFETFDRAEIIVPNADLISQQVTNWTFSNKTVRGQLPIGVAYGSPLEKVLGILNKAAREHPNVLTFPEPDSIFVGFGNSSIDFILRFWVRTIDERLQVRTEVAVIIDRLFREEGITIPFPQQDLHIRSMEPEVQTLFGGKPTEPVAAGGEVTQKSNEKEAPEQASDSGEPES